MPALAAIYNEGQVNEGCDVQVFYNTKSSNLAMIMKSGTKTKDSNTTYEAPDNSRVGLIVNPSQIAVARVQGINMVVGFTRKPENISSEPATSNSKDIADSGTSASSNTGAEDKEWDISLISPVYKPLTTTDAKYRNVALSTKGDEGWIYFLRGADKASFQVCEAQLTTQSESVAIPSSAALPGTHLAAYYNPELDNRFIIYQQKDEPNSLYELNIDTKQGGEINNTDGASPGTVLSVTYIKETGVVALYYTDTAKKIRKIYKPKGGSWQNSTSITGNGATQKVDADSQLTNTVIEGNVHLFWSANKALNPLSHNVDKVSA